MNRLRPDKIDVYKDHVARVFDTPDVEAIVRRDLARFDPDAKRS